MSFLHALAHRQVGSGPDVVFLHGWPLHGETFRHIVPHLADRFTCHVFDMPGTGRSVWDASTPISIATHAEAVLAAIEELGLSRVGFVAHDSGGAIARLAAARLGARCFGLVIGNTEIPGYHPPMLERFIRLMRFPGGRALLRQVLRWRRLRLSSIGLGSGFADPTAIDGEFTKLFVEPLVTSTRAAAGQLGLVAGFDWRVIDGMVATHAQITAPVRLLWGVDDPWFPARLAKAMVPQFAGGADFIELRPGRTFVHEEQPARWAQLAREHLEQATRRAGGTVVGTCGDVRSSSRS